MQMLRFLRRVFIILILLIIVFFIFRFIKPEATSRFVDKVKWIPTTISSRFHREKKSEIVINGNTTSTSSNFEINEDNGDNYEYDNEIYIPVVIDEDINTTNEIEDEDNGEMKDMSRLDELNQELDKILKSWNNIIENNNESQSWNNIQITETTWATLPSGFVVVDVEQPYTWTNQTNTQTNTTTNTTINTWNSSSINTQNNNTTSNNNTFQQWDCGPWLSVQDCKDLMRDLGSIDID